MNIKSGSEEIRGSFSTLPASLAADDRELDRRLRDSVFRFFRLELRPEELDYHWERLLHHHRGQLGDRSDRDLRTSAFDYFLNQARLINEPLVVERESLTKAEALAYSDPVTGLFNYGYFESETRLEVARALRYGRPLCLVLLDVDRFKQINDDHGHPAGNRVLKELGAVLRAGVRSSDVVARIGGDEFAVLLHQADLPTGIRVASMLRQAVAARFATLQLGADAARLTVSAGVSGLPENASSVPELIEAADRALYHSKRCGRNRLSFLSEGRLVSQRGHPRTGRVGSLSRTAKV